MKRIVIFSGTTEGRELSGLLAQRKIFHEVCVATGYGREIINEGPYVKINSGRMDEGEIAAFLDKEDGRDTTVIDATHPYAKEVTANIKNAAEKTGASYIRISRKKEYIDDGSIEFFEDMEECARFLEKSDGNILLTTGSKELKSFTDHFGDDSGSRIYVRVIPSEESLMLCKQAGIPASNIAAMQGPFKKELNRALIKQYDIRHLVTKDSGAEGGFKEKLDAAKELGVKVYVIKRPEEEDGVSVKEAFSMIAGPQEDNGAISVTLIGYGPGGEDCLTKAAQKAIEESEALFGAKRLTEGIRHKRKFPMYLPEDIIDVLEREKIRNAAIVFSGDTGFYSGAKKMREALNKWKSTVKISQICGISSFSYLAAKLGLSYEDAAFFSIHGRNSDDDIAALAEKIRYVEKAFVLLSKAGDVSRIAKALTECGLEGELVLGRDLSYENEEIRRMSYEEALTYEGEGIVSLFIQNDRRIGRPLLGVKRDEEFIRDNVPMTKECIRHESLIRLNLRQGDLFYDIGAGTGSVAIEAASLSESIRVTAIEKNEKAAELIRKNIKKAGVPNVTLIEKDAEDALLELEKPDRVFIGGSGGKLSKIVSILHQKGSGIRFVINAVSLETVEEVRRILEAYGPEDEETVMIQVNDVKKTGTHRMMKALNPVWIFSFTL